MKLKIALLIVGGIAGLGLGLGVAWGYQYVGSYEPPLMS